MCFMNYLGKGGGYIKRIKEQRVLCGKKNVFKFSRPSSSTIDGF